MISSERGPICRSRDISCLVAIERKADMRLRRYDFRV